MKKFFGVTIVTLLLDQISKLLVVTNLKLTDTISIIPNFFRITYLQNTGGAFSIFTNHIPLLIIFNCFLVFLNYYQ